jgi:hypothetical protein
MFFVCPSNVCFSTRIDLRHGPSQLRGGTIFSGATPDRTAIRAQTFGTYMRVSAGRSPAIAEKVFIFAP